jgi:hypothetical protein
MRKFWHGNVIVHPFRMVDQTVTGSTFKVRHHPRGDEWPAGAVRVLSHNGARNIIQTITVAAGSASYIVCAVPRVSDNHDADCERVERFISAVFFGEPTEGLDSAPALPDTSA